MIVCKSVKEVEMWEKRNKGKRLSKRLYMNVYLRENENCCAYLYACLLEQKCEVARVLTCSYVCIYAKRRASAHSNAYVSVYTYIYNCLCA